MKFFTILILAILIVGCTNHENTNHGEEINKESTMGSNNTHKLNEFERKKAEDSVRSLMQSYNKAMDALDAEKILTHFRDSPDFVYKRKRKS